MSKVGNLPLDCGLIDLDPTEMMFWMYLPIKIPYGQFRVPSNLNQYAPLIQAVLEREYVGNYYVYITAKTLWVDGNYIGNRPGWHIDGYGTDDINYIWSDRAPTEFMYVKDNLMIDLSDDCDKSLVDMDYMSYAGSPIIRFATYPDKHLLRLDNTVMHRSPVSFEAGMRTFVKISISKEQYNLKGNSINHLLPESHWPLVDRQEVRNHPVYKNSDYVKKD